MNEYVNQALVLFNKVIVAATPIAQKAWEISMLTLQIDALADMVPFLMLIVGSVVVVLWLRWFRAKEIKAYRDVCDKIDDWNSRCTEGERYRVRENYPAESRYTVFDKPGLGLTWIVVLSPAVVGIYNLCNVWLWVKLFQPELWLAHMAIEKLVK